MIRSMWLSQIRLDQKQTFRALLESEKGNLCEEWKRRGIETCSVFAYHRLLYGYMETIDAATNEQSCMWPQPFIDWLEPWPGQEVPRYCVPMMDVFHDSQPTSSSLWRQDYEAKHKVGSLARLKPERYASYVFYHYQKQEETPGSFNKYYTIGSHEHVIFSYSELPAIQDPLAPPGLLHTQQSPSHWHEVMEPHFEPWEDTSEGERLWRKLDCWLSY